MMNPRENKTTERRSRSGSRAQQRWATSSLTLAAAVVLTLVLTACVPGAAAADTGVASSSGSTYRRSSVQDFISAVRAFAGYDDDDDESESQSLRSGSREKEASLGAPDPEEGAGGDSWGATSSDRAATRKDDRVEDRAEDRTDDRVDDSADARVAARKATRWGVHELANPDDP